MSSVIPTRTLRTLALAAGSLLLAGAVNAEQINFENWTVVSGSYIDGGSSAPGFADEAVGSLYAVFDPVTLQVGEGLSFTGNVAFAGIPTSTAISANNFKWGLFDSNGSTNENNWRGWITGSPGNNANNTGTTNGRTYQKLAASGGNFYAGGSLASRVDNQSAGAPLTTGTYSLTFTLLRVEAGLQVSWSMIGQSSDFNFSGSYLAPNASVESWTFDRIGLSAQSGGFRGKSTGMQYSDLKLEFTPAIPEPASTAVLVGAIAIAGALLYRRRK